MVHLFFCAKNRHIPKYQLDTDIDFLLIYYLVNLADGIYTIKTKDVAGNISENISFEVDKTKPVIELETTRNTLDDKVIISITEKNEYTTQISGKRILRILDSLAPECLSR
mgnify:CR=1 FL=1